METFYIIEIKWITQNKISLLRTIKDSLKNWLVMIIIRSCNFIKKKKRFFRNSKKIFCHIIKIIKNLFFFNNCWSTHKFKLEINDDETLFHILPNHLKKYAKKNYVNYRNKLRNYSLGQKYLNFCKKQHKVN